MVDFFGGISKTTTPKSKWTVWLIVDSGANTKYNVAKGSKMFNTEKEAEVWIDNYVSSLPFGTSVSSYGVMEIPK
ncbi:hypothetical protein [Enterococcus sp. AZ196]|uniref:hypothetical protein n=1 Tax=Enterococcus sp. AZ196 TaxID=2774659 RepID=UPI003D2845D4